MRRSKTRAVAAGLAAAALTALAPPGLAAPDPAFRDPASRVRAGALQADLVLVNGRILTVDATDRVAEALAVRAGRIIAVGTTSEISPLIGPGTQVIDLKGRAATPGLIDAHAHVLQTGVLKLYALDVSGAGSVQEILGAVAARAAALPPGAWIRGAGWDASKLREGRPPTARELDAAAQGRPVWLEDNTGHYGVASAGALREAGIDRTTPDPPAGKIEHFGDGEPNGILKEAAEGKVRPLIPPPSPEQLRKALLDMVQMAHSEGMTGFKDPRINSREEREAYRSLAAEGRLAMHVCVLFYTPPTPDGARTTLAKIRSAQADVTSEGLNSLGVCGAKIFMDGAVRPHTAWMSQPFRGDASNSGHPSLDPELYRQDVKFFVREGVSVGTHAIGDRAVDWVVDTYTEALKEDPKPGLRLAVIHAMMVSPHALAAMADLQKRYDSGIPEVQPGFIWWLGGGFPAAIGEARSRSVSPLRTFQSSGLIWAGGSDAPVTPIPARYGLAASVARELVGGHDVLGPEERVDVHAALRSYTLWAARQLFIETRTGSLEAGKEADIAVWDRDPYESAPEGLKDMVCEMTLQGGAVVYSRAGSDLGAEHRD